MVVGNYTRSPVYTGSNYKEVVRSFPFYLTRDKQDVLDASKYYSIQRSKGEARICGGQDPETKEVHFFTNVGTITLKVGEQLEFMEVE